MRTHTKRLLGYLLVITLVFSDLYVVAYAENKTVTTETEAKEVVTESEAIKTESQGTLVEPEIISELTEKRDETTKYFAMSDGTIKACIYPQNVHYLENGKYEEIDNTLVETKEDGKSYYKNKKNNFLVKIPELFTNDYIEFSDENGYVKFRLEGATNKKIEKLKKEQAKENTDKTAVNNVNDKAIFKSIKGNIDIEYDLSGNKLKETIILYKKTKNSFVFDVQTSTASAIVNADNSISFFDLEGTEHYIIASPYMVDSAGEYSNAIKTELIKNANGYTLAYTPDYKWLSAKERQYPVKIDPTMFQAIYKETVADTYVTNAQTASDTRGYWDIMNIGKRTTTTGGEQIVLRGLIKFNIPSEIGSNDCIVDAKLDLVHCNYTDYISNNGIQIDVHELTQPFSEENAWWGNQPSYDPIITDCAIVNTGNYFSGTSLSYDSYNITKLVNKWHNGAINHGIILKLHDDNSIVSSRQQVYYFAKQSIYYGTVSKFVEITYRNAVGLEDYWSYTTQDFGQYGTGYVNNYNGNLVYVHEDTSFNSLINGFTLSHVYNTNLASEGMGYYGSGWRLNLVQELEPITVTGNSSVKYVYTDGDGTRHYFVETSDGKIVDEDGLGYCYENISEGNLIRKLTSKNGIELKFDSENYLRNIIDSNGNKININYTSNQLTSITTSSGGEFTLDYDSNSRLISIKDNAMRVTSLYYNSDALTEIHYPDGAVLKLEYFLDTYLLKEIVAPDKTKLQYEYISSNCKVSATAFWGKNNIMSSKTSFQYAQNQTRVLDYENRGTTYQFDMLGRVACAYDDKSQVYNQTYNATTRANKGVFNNNKLSSTNNHAGYIDNMLMNGVFANELEYWQTYSQSSNVQRTVISGNGLLSSKSVKIENSNQTIETIMQFIHISDKGQYTFSGYLKTDDVDSISHGAGLEVVVNSPTCDKYYYSEFLTGTTDTTIENGFQRVSVTFYLEEGETINRVSAGLFGATGIVYIDSLQFEKGSTDNTINLVDNSSFESYNGSNLTPIGFEAGNTGKVSGQECHSGSVSCEIDGVGTENRTITKRINISGNAGDIYTFGGWAKANAVPNHQKDNVNYADFALHAIIYDNTTTVEHIIIKFNEYVSEWQCSSKTFIISDVYTHIQIFCSYDFNCNKVYYDDLFLYRDTMQSYTYDQAGNIISAINYEEQNSQYNYNHNNLSKILEPIGSGYEYFYNSNNDLISSRSSEGIVTDIDYDSNGNPIHTIMYGDSSSTALQSGKSYYIQQKLSGKFLTVENSGTTALSNVIEAPYTGTKEQRWKIVKSTKGGFFLYPENVLNMALDVYEPNISNEYNVHIYWQNNSNAQIFNFVPQKDFTYQIIQPSSEDGKVFTVNRDITDNNVTALAPQGECHPSQSWYIKEVEEQVHTIQDGIYQIRAIHSGKYLDNYTLIDGASIIQYEYNLLSNVQRFKIQQYNNTDYYLISPAEVNNLYLEVDTVLNNDTCKSIKLGNSVINDDKLFKIQYDETLKAWIIIPKCNENECVEVYQSNVDNLANVVTNIYNSNLNQAFVFERLSDGVTSSATYQDNGNYPHTTTDARGYTTTYTYDTSRGLQTGVTDAKGTTTTYAYNTLNDRLELVTSGNSMVNYQYETNGAIKKITSPSGSTYNFIYDVFGRTSRIAIGNTTLSETTYKNNASSLVTRFDYGNGAYKTYEYDNQDRLISEGVNGTTSRTYIYDKQGNIAQTTDYLTNETTTYTHDLIGRISRIKSSDGQTTNFVYDKYNRLSLSKWSKGDTTLSSSYIYGDNSVANQKIGLIYGVKLNGRQQLGYEYDELARLQRRLLYTTTPFATEYTYLEGASANTTTTLVKTVKNGNDTLEYTYDETGNITSVSKNGTIIEQYAYDALSQLISATYGGNTYTYSYDNGGNLTEITKNGEVIKTYTYGNSEWKDQLTGFNSETITYDAIGNSLIYRNGINFTWQNGRQLATVTQNGSAVATYTYNADGLRNTKTVNGTTTEYYWQNGTLYGQKTGDESIFYLYDENGTAYGFIYKNSTEQSHYYYEFNLQGDIIGIIDSTGTRVVEYTYGAWGDLISVTGTLADTIGQKNPLRYRGYYYDAETGFYYVSSRYYDPEIGRFLNADTADVLDVQSDLYDKNLYAYCDNNPVMRVDYSGKVWITVGIMAVGGAIGGVIGAVSSAVTQKSLTGTVNWKSVVVAGAGGFVSGAVAASPLGLIGQVVAGSIIGSLSYVADCKVNKKSVAMDELAVATLGGTVSGIIGGPGANQNMTLTKTIQTSIKTTTRMSSRACTTYAAKQIASTKAWRNNILTVNAMGSSARFAAGTGVSNVIASALSTVKGWFSKLFN